MNTIYRILIAILIITILFLACRIASHDIIAIDGEIRIYTKNASNLILINDSTFGVVSYRNTGIMFACFSPDGCYVRSMVNWQLP